MLVVLNHLRPLRVPGGYIGVDIFFVVSGFLITKHLFENIRSGKLNFLEFYTRRARRLLPAALTTLAVTAAGVWLFSTPAHRAELFDDIAAAALYVANWRLAFNAVNYFAADPSRSLVNHFWSLGVEEQFYLIWPCLLLFASKVGSPKISMRLPTRATVLLVVLGLASFAAAILAVNANKAGAYFYTHTRIWEFCVGGLAAISEPRWRNAVRYWRWITPFAWAVLLASAWLLDSESGVPGAAALPATLATALIMMAGDNHGLRPLDAVIRQRPVQWTGDSSYSIYLWHWPIFAFWPSFVPISIDTSLGALLAVGATLIIAALSRYLVEDRFRKPAKGARKRSGLALASCLILSLLIAASAEAEAAGINSQSRIAAQSLYRQSLAPANCFGARATESGARCPASHQLADGTYILHSWATQVYRPGTETNCQADLGQSTVRRCFYGRGQGPANVALVGDSHASMWIAALVEISTRANMRLASYTASSCSLTLSANTYATSLRPEYRRACQDWRRTVIAEIAHDPAIGIVIVSGHVNNERRVAANGGWMDDDGTGYVEAWRQLLAAGKRVVVIDDVPSLPFDPPNCLWASKQANDPCTIPLAMAPAANGFTRAASQIHDPRFRFVSFRDVFCDQSACHTVIGGIPAYLDSGHVSAPFARSLAPRLLPYLTPATGG